MHAKLSPRTSKSNRDAIAHIQSLASEIIDLAKNIPLDNNINFSQNDYIKLAKDIYKFRRDRERFIPGIFGEPAWDILLDLFIARCEGRKLTVKSVQISSSVPPTTSLRWIKILMDEGLLEKDRHAFDSRVRVVRLTDRGFDIMKKLLSSQYKIDGDAEVIQGDFRELNKGLPAS